MWLSVGSLNFHILVKFNLISIYINSNKELMCGKVVRAVDVVVTQIVDRTNGLYIEKNIAPLHSLNSCITNTLKATLLE